MSRAPGRFAAAAAHRPMSVRIWAHRRPRWTDAPDRSAAEVRRAQEDPPRVHLRYGPVPARVPSATMRKTTDCAAWGLAPLRRALPRTARRRARARPTRAHNAYAAALTIARQALRFPHPAGRG